jgi:sphingolipid delta-4 desaturase
LVAYTLGAWLGFANIVLGHDALHNLVFKNEWANRAMGMLAFTCTFLGPFPAFWQTEHNWHHSIVVDKVIRFGEHQNSLVKKLAAATFMYLAISIFYGVVSFLLVVQVAVHALLFLVGRRSSWLPTSSPIPPFNRFPKVISLFFVINTVIAYSYQGWLVYNYGIWALGFQVLSNSINNGLHPLGMRNVQEHYYIRKDQPTSSVYCNWYTNALTMNIGYHVEHHDFNVIPNSRLYRLREIAPEFYNNLFSYTSYTEVFLRFMTDTGIPLSLVFEGNPVYEGITESHKD